MKPKANMGDKYFDRTNGYWIMCVRGHPLFPGRTWVAEHRVVMAEKLDRRLKSSELVHHKDEDGTNNSPRSLELKTRQSHARLHATGKTRSIQTRQKLSIKARERNMRPEYSRMLRERAIRQHREGSLGRRS